MPPTVTSAFAHPSDSTGATCHRFEPLRRSRPGCGSANSPSSPQPPTALRQRLREARRQNLGQHGLKLGPGAGALALAQEVFGFEIGRKVDRKRVAFAPVGRDLKNRGAREAAMGEQDIFAETSGGRMKRPRQLRRRSATGKAPSMSPANFSPTKPGRGSITPRPKRRARS